MFFIHRLKPFIRAVFTRHFDWYICYHRFNTALYGSQATQSSAAGNHREVCIDKLEFDENGNIKQVIPTLKGITEPVTAGAQSPAPTPTWRPAGSVEISKAEINQNSLDYELTVTGVSGADIYTALYTSDGALAGVKKNEISGSFEIEPVMQYKLKVITWKENSVEPYGMPCAEKTINIE